MLNTSQARTATPLHDRVFGRGGSVPDNHSAGTVHYMNIVAPAVMLDHNQPLRHVGDNEQRDYQPDGRYR